MFFHHSFFPKPYPISPLIQIFPRTELIQFRGFLHGSPTQFSLRIIHKVDRDLFCFYLQTGYLGIKDIGWFLYMYLCIREEHILTSDVLSHSQEDRWAQRKGYAPGFGGPAEGTRRPGLPAILKCQTQAVGSTGEGQTGGEEAMVGMNEPSERSCACSRECVALGNGKNV